MYIYTYIFKWLYTAHIRMQGTYTLNAARISHDNSSSLVILFFQKKVDVLSVFIPCLFPEYTCSPRLMLSCYLSRIRITSWCSSLDDYIFRLRRVCISLLNNSFAQSTYFVWYPYFSEKVPDIHYEYIRFMVNLDIIDVFIYSISMSL